MRILFIFISILWSVEAIGHEKLILQGSVLDEDGQPLIGGHVFLDNAVVASDFEGKFRFIDLEPGTYRLKCNFIGYQPYQSIISIINDTSITIHLKPDIINLGEVVIVDYRNGNGISLKSESMGSAEILAKYSGSFVKSIESIPGVNAMDIGASMSKPVIRGLGFNRIVVAENGIKQEGQQWGADHGLEIDPFNVEKASVIKGASSIEYGSDAIGGVINIENSVLPERHSFSGDVSLLAKSVNNTIGGSLFAQYRGDRYYFKLRGTLLDYGDYKVPTDRINYLNWIIPVYNNRLKNTAGKEIDYYIVGGYLSDHFRSSLSISHVDQTNGFFPGSHGRPSLERVEDDGNSRNVEYPYQHSRHLKIINNSVWILGDHDFHLDLGYQANKRQEWSEFHTHFSGQLPSDINPDLELDFSLKTISANAKYHFHIGNNNLTFGTQNQFQENTIGGYNFFLPEFTRTNLGLFAKNEWDINKRLKTTLGLRYDWGRNENVGFYDSLLYQDLVSRGFEDQAEFYAQRSIASTKTDGNFSWLAGLTYQITQKWTSGFNLGRSFRFPLALELGANGIHHGSFRHELGNPTLDSEVGYYVDGAMEFQSNHFSFSLNPYLYYFTNYIFINPTGKSLLRHAGQVYEYSQSKAMHAGAEFMVSKDIGKRLKFSGNLEYIYNQQLSGRYKNYPLPFTPPINGFSELEYRFGSLIDKESKFSVHINSKFALRQNHLSINEESTPGYQIFGLGLTSNLAFGKSTINISLQAQNIFNTKYYNHISFYRKLEIPEPGRNLQLLMKIPINK